MDGNNVETVTTVPKQQEQQQFNKEHIKIEATTLEKSTTITTTTKAAAAIRAEAAATSAVVTSLSSSPSLLNSSSTALAKFNRIIDSTMPATNVYQQLQQVSSTSGGDAPVLSSALQQRLALVYPDIVSNDSQSKKINFTTTATTTTAKQTATATRTRTKAKVKSKAATLGRMSVGETPSTVARGAAAAGAATASNDDNQMKRNDVHYLLKQLNSFSDIEEIEIVDMEQRQQQLELQLQQHQQQQQQAQQQYVAGSEKPHSPTATSLVIISPSSQSHKGIRRYASLHQQQYEQHPLADDGAVDSVEQQQYFLQQFDDYLFQSCHYLETNYFAANYRTAMVESSSHEFRPSTTTGTSATSESSGESLELHETEPPSVICKAAPPSAVTPTPSPPITLSPPGALGAGGTAAATTAAAMSQPQRYQMQTRLTSSGVQTELTAATSMLSAATTDASLAKSSSSSGGSEEQRRRAPFFKCCYTPIDRWREKRTAATHKRGGESGSGCGGASSQQHGRKNGHAV